MASKHGSLLGSQKGGVASRGHHSTKGGVDGVDGAATDASGGGHGGVSGKLVGST